MAGIPFPKLVTVAQFSPPTGEPSYSQIFAETMGNAGTPDDGFDQQFAQMAALTDSAFLDEADYANDLLSLSDLAGGFADAAEGALAVAIQPASDATDAALSDYGVLVPPPASPTQPVSTPQGTQPPGSTTTQDCSPPPGQHAATLTMHLGDPPQDSIVGSGQQGVHFDTVPIVTLTCGDATVFSLYQKVTHLGIGGTSGPVTQVDFYLRVTASKPGTFKATVSDRQRGAGAPAPTQGYFEVTIS